VTLTVAAAMSVRVQPKYRYSTSQATDHFSGHKKQIPAHSHQAPFLQYMESRGQRKIFEMHPSTCWAFSRTQIHYSKARALDEPRHHQ
jgi:hypothetical protein